MTNAANARTAEPIYRKPHYPRPQPGQPLAPQNDRFESFAFEVACDDRTDEELMASLVDPSLDAYGEEPDFGFVRVESVNGVHRLYCPGCGAHSETLTPEGYAEACDEERLVDAAMCSWCTREDLVPEAPLPAYRALGGLAVQCQRCKTRVAGALDVEQLRDAERRGILEQVATCHACSLAGIV